MARTVLSGLIQASNPLNDETKSVAEIQAAMFEKHLPMIHEAGKKGVQISGIGGIETGFDAAQFFLLGASTVQICTGAMLRGYEIITELKEELSKFMVDHKFANIREFVGKSLPYFTTHHDLVDRQKSARDAKEAARATKTARDVETWKGDIAKETSTLVTN